MHSASSTIGLDPWSEEKLQDVHKTGRKLASLIVTIGWPMLLSHARPRLEVVPNSMTNVATPLTRLFSRGCRSKAGIEAVANSVTHVCPTAQERTVIASGRQERSLGGTSRAGASQQPTSYR